MCFRNEELGMEYDSKLKKYIGKGYKYIFNVL